MQGIGLNKHVFVIKDETIGLFSLPSSSKLPSHSERKFLKCFSGWFSPFYYLKLFPLGKDIQLGLLMELNVISSCYTHFFPLETLFTCGKPVLYSSQFGKRRENFPAPSELLASLLFSHFVFYLPELLELRKQK